MQDERNKESVSVCACDVHTHTHSVLIIIIYFLEKIEKDVQRSVKMRNKIQHPR